MNSYSISTGTGSQVSVLFMPRCIVSLTTTSQFSSEFNTAVNLYNKSNYPSALKLFKTLLKLGACKFSCLNNIACCNFHLNQKSKSYSSLKSALLLSHSEIPIYNLALLHTIDLDFMQASRVLNLWNKNSTNLYLQLKKFVDEKNEVPIISKRQNFVRYFAKNESLNKIAELKSFKLSNEVLNGVKKKFFKVVENYDWKKFVLAKGRSNEISKEIRDKSRCRSLVKLRPIQTVFQNKESRAESPEELYGKSQPKKLHQYIRHSKPSTNSSVFIQENVETSEFFSQRFYDKNSKPSGPVITESDLQTPTPIQSPKPSLESKKSIYTSQNDLKQILFELQKPEPERNFEALDSLIKNNPFFSRFKKNTRVKLLTLSNIVSVKANQLILAAGQTVPHLFVIVKGSVVLEKVSAEFGNHSVEVATLYDGRYFGELSLVPQEEKASIKAFMNTKCKAIEDTVLIMLDKVKYNEILIEQIEFDLEKKYKLLTVVDFFKGINPYLLIPLASSLKVKRFGHSETILQAGKVPEGLIFILKGFVSLVAEGFRIIKNDKLQSLNGEKIGKIKKTKKKTQKTKENELNNLVLTVSSETWKEILTQITVEEKNLQIENKSLVAERIEYKILAENDYFATRALIIPAKNPGSPVPPSKFSIVTKN